MNFEVTQFQIEAEREVTGLLVSAGLRILERRIMTAQMPHMPVPETAIKLYSDGVDIWLYDDGATYTTAKSDRRYELDDYQDASVLLLSLLSDLRDDLDLPRD